jgi:hypothetical protein
MFYLRWYLGGVVEESYLSLESALDEAFSRMRTSNGTPVYIRQDDTVVMTYMEILREFNKR